MNKTKIDWCDMTWNPVTGCLHGCDYCYARKIAKRFGGYTLSSGKTLHEPLPGETGILDDHLLKRLKNNSTLYHAPFPYDFKPTFHKYRLNEPRKIRKPSKIFVCSMADLFGDWVPDEWIEEVFKACEEAPQHKYLFLTKDPDKYCDLYNYRMLPFKDNFWYGSTITKTEDNFAFDKSSTKPDNNYFLSIEPILGETKIFQYFLKRIKWVIVGQQTGPCAVSPQGEWVQSIIDQCRQAGVPVFIKKPLYEKFPIQEWPEGLKGGE